ncbi:catechol oxidase [Salvia divinorum]|uniref:Catechol oxidase n=1 Tax=Salvia divinorum TaxID=28513 RepID=A0ABD1G0L1_SALDI
MGNKKIEHIDANCCPPYTGPATDYVLPPAPYLRVRQAAHRVSPAYIANYKLAIQRMKELDQTDPDDPRGFKQQANIHCAYCNGPYDQQGFPTLDIQVHNSWIFFPFHRWYLYFFERICGELVGPTGTGTTPMACTCPPCSLKATRRSTTATATKRTMATPSSTSASAPG